MSDDNTNPYQSPEAPIIPENISNRILTGKMIIYLKDTSPWLRFIGILGYIGFGTICLMAVISLIVSIAVGEIPGLESLGAVSGIVLFLLLGVFAAIVFFPAHFTYKFGSYIRNYINSNSTADLETAFKFNKLFWLVYGIITIVYLAFSILGIPGIIAAIGAASLF